MIWKKKKHYYYATIFLSFVEQFIINGLYYIFLVRITYSLLLLQLYNTVEALFVLKFLVAGMLRQQQFSTILNKWDKWDEGEKRERERIYVYFIH